MAIMPLQLTDRVRIALPRCRIYFDRGATDRAFGDHQPGSANLQMPAYPLELGPGGGVVEQDVGTEPRVLPRRADISPEGA